MATSSNFEGTMELTAPAGGVTVGTLVYNSTSKMVVLPMTAATSGNTYTAKVVGLVKSVLKVTGAAWTQGRSLSWTSTKFKSCTGSTSQATAFNAAASGDTTGDVILRFPVTAPA